jgi:hypothetical protein
MKMIAPLFVAALVLGGVALAQNKPVDESDFATARALNENGNQADAVASAMDADVSAIVVTLQIPGPNGQASVGLVPGDPEFAAVLAALKTAAARKRDEADTALGALGFSRKPRATPEPAPAAPEGVGNPN